VNPLLGASEGEQRKLLLQREYYNYMQKQTRKDLNDSPSSSLERSLSKRQTFYLQKKKEAEQKSPQQEPNLYATK
jgi:hypothetical protein